MNPVPGSTASCATSLPPVPDPAAIAAGRAALAATRSNPWLAGLWMRRMASIGARLSALRDWLAALPRRLRRGWARRLACGLPLAALALAMAVGAARAATITVGTGGCTLQDAITAANTDTATGGCPAGSGPDVIEFDALNGTYLLNNNYGVMLPSISTAITIQGNGNTTLDGEGALRVLDINPGGDLTLIDATITGGSASFGGGIDIYDGVLRATNVIFQGNYAEDDGGALLAEDSTIELTNCTLSGNTAGSDGGGARLAPESTATIRMSTISGNSAGEGGGLVVDGSHAYIYDSAITGNTAAYDGGGIQGSYVDVRIFNSTISGNSARLDGGGFRFYEGESLLINVTISGNTAGRIGGAIYAQSSLVRIDFCTITGNSAGDAVSGIYARTFPPSIRNSIVAHQATSSDCGGTLPASYGYNIEGGTACDFTAPGDQQNVSVAALGLGPLVLNAPGTTQTHAIDSTSAAYNGVPDTMNGCGTDVTDDQRGVARPQFGDCDVGAYEVAPDATATPTPTPTATPAPGAPTAATIAHFAAAPDATGRVRVAWETTSESDVAGFRVERAALGASTDPARPVGPWLAVGGLVAARGGAAVGDRYAVVDAVAPGAYAYRLVVVDQDGPPTYHGPAVARVDALRAFVPWVGRR